MANKFVRYALSFSAATFISRIFGYIRDAVVAYVFGASHLTDAFFVAWRLPNTLRQLVAEGSFNAVFIPIYQSILEKDPNQARAYINSLFSYYTLILSLITILAVIFAKVIVLLIAPGFAKDERLLELAANLVRLTFPYLVLVGMVSFFMAVLNTRGRFFLPALTPALLNLSFIVSALLLSSYTGIYALAVGALVGGFLQVVLTFWQFKREGFSIRFTFAKSLYLKETLKKILPSFASFGINQFSFIIDTIIASLIMAGAVSYLYYANRVFQLPIGVFAIGLGNALLVTLSKSFERKDINAILSDIQNSLKLSIIVAIPATFGMVVIGKEIIEVLFQHGVFDKKDVEYTYYALIGYAVGLLFYTASRPFKSGFFAIKDVKTPVLATAVGLLGGILSALVLVFGLGLSVFGLALASSLAGLFTLFYLWYFFPYKVELKPLFKTFVKSLIAATLFSIFILTIKGFINNAGLIVLLSIPTAVAIYFLTLYLLREDTIKLLKRKG